MTETPGKQAGNAPGHQPTGQRAPGADAPELDELARRLLDLWQDQLAAVAANPDLATQAARLMAAMPLPGMWLSQLGQMGGATTTPGNGSAADMTKLWAKMAQDWMAQDWFKGVQSGRSGEPAKSTAAPPPAGPTPAAAASGPGGGDLVELSRRLAGIEQRLGELAEQSTKSKPSRAKPKSAASPKKPRRPRAADKPGGTGGADGGTSG
ncbi:hypothetical protein [Dongia mobilis]|uniref:hypothetical protein n=1 Tax=Dongia sp. TaxID=1977262 RepID=UPI0026F2CB4F